MRYIINVTIRQTIGNSITIRIDVNESIKNLKKIIEKNLGISQCQQILRFNGTFLEDNKSLDYYCIESDDTIILAIRRSENFGGKTYKSENLNEKISKLEKELEEEKNKNIVLMLKITNLEDYIKNLKNELSTYENKLKSKSQISFSGDVKAEEIMKLVNQINQKDEEIKDLRANMPFNLKQGEKLISVIFISVDQKIHYSIICKNTDIFTNVENKLYDEYPEYRETENYFMVSGQKVNKYKSLKENKIVNSSIINLNQYC